MIEFISQNLYYIYLGVIILVAILVAILFIWPTKPINPNTFFRLK